MALIDCSECGKQISDKAISCPNCGNPINQTIDVAKIENTELLQFPNLPKNLEIGEEKEVAIFAGFYDGNEHVNTRLPINGEIHVNSHINGIKLSSVPWLGSAYFEIHNSQIISLKQTTLSKISEMDKSVIGRAVVGGLILGPIGAVVGGMSGIRNKKKIVDKNYLVINYWDIETKSIQTLLISGKIEMIAFFIGRHNSEDVQYKIEGFKEKP